MCTNSRQHAEARRKHAHDIEVMPLCRIMELNAAAVREQGLRHVAERGAVEEQRGRRAAEALNADVAAALLAPGM